MGSPFTITIETTDSSAASNAAAAAFHLADSLNTILSDYIDSSEINRLSATSGQGRSVPVSPPLFDILRRAQEAAVLTAGAYDITVGPVVRLWRKARKTGVPPTQTDIAQGLQNTGYHYLHLDSTSQTVLLEKRGMQLDVGGLGKGFVAAAALGLLRSRGYPVAMVNAGGKIVTGDAPAGRLNSAANTPTADQTRRPNPAATRPAAAGPGWIIGINAPGQKEQLLSLYLSLHNNSVATSGDLYQYIEWQGKRYSHIIDPRTGIGLTRRRNVTAIATDGTTADWLATACSILSWRESLKLLKRIPNAALLVTEIKRGKIIQKTSVNFKKYLLPDASASHRSPL